MSMTAAGMAAAIKTQLEGVYDIVSESQLNDFCNAMGTAIVEYIQANADVPAGITVQVDPSSGTGATTGEGTVE